MDRVFLNAVIKPPARVCGRRLRPLCAWHLVYLEAIGSGFVTQRPPTLEDLRTAVEVCSAPLDRLPDGEWMLRRLESRTRQWRWMLWMLARSERRRRREVLAFLGYLHRHGNHPELLYPTDARGNRRTRPSGAPYVLRKVMQAGGRPEHWTMPIDRLEWEVATRLELDPWVDVRFDPTVELRRNLAEQRAAEARKRAEAAS